MADTAAPTTAATSPAKPIKTPAPPTPKVQPGGADPASVTLGAGAAPAPKPPVERARDERTGQFLPRDQSVDLQDKLWGEGQVEVAPEDRAVTDLDGNEPREVRLRVSRPYAGGPGSDAPTLGAAPEGGEAAPQGGEAEQGGAGVEQPGVQPPTQEAAPPVPPAAGEPDLTDPNALIELVIDGSPVVYKNRAHLVQAVKSLRGMYNTAERERLRHVQANHQNFSSAQAWERIARGLGYQDGQPVPGGQAPSADVPAAQGRSQAPSSGAGQDAAGRQAAAAISDATGAPEEQIAAAVDWDVYNEIKKAKGSEVAILWANARMIAAATSRTSQRIEELQRPSKEAEAQFREGHAYGETLQDMAGWANDDGSLTYPELTDDAAIEEIGRALAAFRKQGVSPEFLKTPRGMHTVILSWRDWRAAKGNPWRPNLAPQPQAAPPSDAANPSPNADVEQAVASVARTITGRQAPTRPATAHDTRERRVKDSILTADKNPHGDEFPWAP